MSEFKLLAKKQMRRIEPLFPVLHGILRADSRRIVSGSVLVIRYGLRWRDAPLAYGTYKTV
jgi:transposase